MDHKVKITEFVIEGNRFSGWETSTNFKKLFCADFLTILESIADANWQFIILFNFKVGDLEVWREHSCLKGTATGDTVRGVKSTLWSFAKDFFDLFDSIWYTGRFTNKFYKFDFLFVKSWYSGTNFFNRLL